MSSPAGLKFLTTHEWHKLDGNTVTVGISRFAVDELTDVTYVSLPKVGASFNAGQSIGEIESVKATSEIYTGVAGKVVAVNDDAVKNPHIINEDPFGKGWLVKIEATNAAGDLAALLDTAAYDAKYPSAH